MTQTWYRNKWANQLTSFNRIKELCCLLTFLYIFPCLPYLRQRYWPMEVTMPIISLVRLKPKCETISSKAVKAKEENGVFHVHKLVRFGSHPWFCAPNSELRKERRKESKHSTDSVWGYKMAWYMYIHE